MRRFITVGIFTTLFCFTSERAAAFSLAGPLPPWQTANLGFQNVPNLNSLVGAAGPMNINEEYRWNIPEIHYGYTAGFLSFFGQSGVDSIEEAVELLNDVPALDGVALEDYPTQSGRMNLRAAALGLTDVKSYVLSLLLQGRGLADPTRYANVIRNRWIENNSITNYRVIKRNFDPETLRPSSFINGTLYNYIIQDPVPPQNYAWALNFPVDPLERILPRTLPVAARDLVDLPAGYFWTALTRDDIGGLKHIYRSSNFNTENALADVAGSGGAGAGGQLGFPGGGDNFDFPANGVGGVGGGTYDFPFDTATNNVAGGQAVNQGVGGAAGAAGGNFINPAVRGGVNRIRMVRADFDSLLGAFFNPLTVRFSETVLTNNRARSQSLTRTLTQPDIIFDAADLQGGEAQIAFTRHNVSGAGGWNNSDALDGTAGDDFGPGVIVPPFTITLNTVGPTFLNLQSSNQFFLQEGSISTQSVFNWASFDGSTNDPVVYPVGSSILELERQVRR